MGDSSRRTILAATFMLLASAAGFACEPTRPQPEYLTGTWLVYPDYQVAITLRDDCTYEAAIINGASSPAVIYGEWGMTDWGFRWITLNLDGTSHRVLPSRSGTLCFPLSIEVIDALATCGWKWNRIDRALDHLERIGDATKAAAIRSWESARAVSESD